MDNLVGVEDLSILVRAPQSLFDLPNTVLEPGSAFSSGNVSQPTIEEPGVVRLGFTLSVGSGVDGQGEVTIQLPLRDGVAEGTIGQIAIDEVSLGTSLEGPEVFGASQLGLSVTVAVLETSPPPAVLAGQETASAQPAGRYEIAWDGRDRTGNELASGVYLYELRAGEFRSVRKMALMK